MGWNLFKLFWILIYFIFFFSKAWEGGEVASGAMVGLGVLGLGSSVAGPPKAGGRWERARPSQLMTQPR